ncbi:hypothetical protein ES703_84379 [subsurface metagenome]
MRTIYSQLVGLVLIGLVGLVTGAAAAEEAGFKAIFDGRTLNGWKAVEMGYWSVDDGAITGRSTRQHPVKSNQFLVWQLGELDDFELKLKYRISGTPSANSGVQVRSRVDKDGHVAGYQADIDRGDQWAGALYDERGRGMLAECGKKTVIGSDGKRTSMSIGDSDALKANINKDGWNDYHIIARGSRIVLKINGKVTAEVIDNDKKDRDLSGVLALQLHAGPPMQIQFKDIHLRRLKMHEKKKVVLVAGPRSHGYGAHEHNAGWLLLAKLLAQLQCQCPPVKPKPRPPSGRSYAHATCSGIPIRARTCGLPPWALSPLLRVLSGGMAVRMGVTFFISLTKRMW